MSVNCSVCICAHVRVSAYVCACVYTCPACQSLLAERGVGGGGVVPEGAAAASQQLSFYCKALMWQNHRLSPALMVLALQAGPAPWPCLAPPHQSGSARLRTASLLSLLMYHRHLTSQWTRSGLTFYDTFSLFYISLF